MAARNTRRNRKAKSATLPLRARAPIEPIACALQFIGGNARAVVEHRQGNPAFLAAQRYVHPAAVRRVANGVVKQVVKQHLEPMRVPEDRVSVTRVRWMLQLEPE